MRTVKPGTLRSRGFAPRLPQEGEARVWGEVLVKDLVWDHLLSVGVDEIDEDHRRLVELFNMLNHSVAEGDDPGYLAALLEELINCTIWHFSHEERLMLKHGYERYAEHKAEHEELIKSVKELQQNILQAGASVANENLTYLEHWLTGHILSDDMKLGSYLNEVM
jgi:hemerythrin-like metal-binding protein